ncbi:membrane protein [Clostridium bornimense]|uniref:Membrane protein n=1 Tax=Clostridium bornimense TaxID=1216932 RepID=W6RZM0_9CLOT|nr:MBOAT family O-acyltransferase [Clostridium bornimense]CDM69893.1 membrane protein [Clostridium bornimense]
MVFSSLTFMFAFLPMVLLAYFIMPKAVRNLTLFLFSLLFYAWGEPIYILIMIFSTIVDYFHGMLIYKYKQCDNNKKSRLILISSIFINLSLLVFFKYSDFFISSVNTIFGSNLKLLNLSLPIGISFYTFQTMSYSIDIYRGTVTPQRNIIDFGTYVALFPQLIAGPIVQYKTIAHQLRNRKESLDQFTYGIIRFVSGLGKKVLIANNVGLIWEEIISSDLSTISVLSSWIGIIMFALQIYFDFSGYSDMAIGLGNMFGFKFKENFNYPYESKSITEFWRRWHISLGSWFKEYVYIPLGGNRRYQVRNICIVWLLTGLWHGASWNFVIWGIYFGSTLLLEKFILKKFFNINSRIYALLLILIGWVIFAFDNLQHGLIYIKSMFSISSNVFIDSNALYILTSNITIIVIGIIASTSIPKKITRYFLKGKENSWTFSIVTSVYILGILILSTASLVNSSYNPFLYFRF